jgi:hypothetical protein
MEGSFVEDYSKDLSKEEKDIVVEHNVLTKEDPLEGALWELNVNDNDLVYTTCLEELCSLFDRKDGCHPCPLEILSPMTNKCFTPTREFLREYDNLKDGMEVCCNLDPYVIENDEAIIRFMIHFVNPLSRNWDRYCLKLEYYVNEHCSQDKADDYMEEDPREIELMLISLHESIRQNEQTTKVDDRLQSDRPFWWLWYNKIRSSLFTLNMRKKEDPNFDWYNHYFLGPGERVRELYRFATYYYSIFTNDFLDDHGDGLTLTQLLTEELGKLVCFISESNSNSEKEKTFAHWFCPFQMRNIIPHLGSWDLPKGVVCADAIQKTNLGGHVFFLQTRIYHCPEKAKEDLFQKEQDLLKPDWGQKIHDDLGKNIDDDELTNTFENSSSDEDEDMNDVNYDDGKEQGKEGGFVRMLKFDGEEESIVKNYLDDTDAITSSFSEEDRGIFRETYVLEYSITNLLILDNWDMVEDLEQFRVRERLREEEI